MSEPVSTFFVSEEDRNQAIEATGRFFMHAGRLVQVG